MTKEAPSLFVANRGEIARRIVRTAKRMGFSTVVGYADQDRDMPFVKEADQSMALRGRSSLETYLNPHKIVEAAHRAGATLLHPGYGFLSENPEFVEAVEARGIRFVGPSARSMRLLGDKVGARHFLKDSKIPLLPFVESRSGESAADLWQRAQSLPFPLLIKPAAGGGGKGMFKVETQLDFLAAVESSQRLALSAFKDDRIFVERFIAKARHIEVQILRDGVGDIFVFGERECSLQRRHQKVIEEAPCIFLPPTVRTRLYEASQNLARIADYRNAGTVEWIWDGEDDIYFLEVNARLQVEHPVTEEIFDIDLVECQLRIALGESLKGLTVSSRTGGLRAAPLKSGAQEPLGSGHSIEARLCAEDPWNHFVPSGGKIRKLFLPPHIRIDFGFEEGNEIPSEFDSLVGKLIAHGSNREEARHRLMDALKSLIIMGPTTNRGFLIRLLDSPAFREGQLYTKLIDEEPVGPDWVALWRVLTSGANLHVELNEPNEEEERDERDLYSPWGSSRENVNEAVTGDATALRFETLGDRHFIHLPVDDWSLRRKSLAQKGAQHLDVDTHELRCPLPAKVIKILVSPGQKTTKNQAVMVIEAMKMEITLKAPCAGTILKIEKREGELMAVDTVVMVWEENERGQKNSQDGGKD